MESFVFLVTSSRASSLNANLSTCNQTKPKSSRPITTRPHHHHNHKRTNNKSTTQLVSLSSKLFIKQNNNNNCAMMLVLVALCALLSQHASLVQGADLQSVLRNFSINPDIVQIPSYTETIKIVLNNNEVKPGDRVPAKNFKDLRNDKIQWSSSSLDARHTLILVDLDRRSPGVNQSQIYNQFTSLNMPDNQIQLGQTIVAFEQPVVPCVQPSTKHRMLMLALHQPNTIDMADVVSFAASSGNSEKRKNFDLRDFIRKNQLTVVAANAFYAMAGDAQGVCSGAMSALQHPTQQMTLLLTTTTTMLIMTLARRSL